MKQLLVLHKLLYLKFLNRIFEYAKTLSKNINNDQSNYHHGCCCCLRLHPRAAVLQDVACDNNTTKGLGMRQEQQNLNFIGLQEEIDRERQRQTTLGVHQHLVEVQSSLL